MAFNSEMTDLVPNINIAYKLKEETGHPTEGLAILVATTDLICEVCTVPPIPLALYPPICFGDTY